MAYNPSSKQYDDDPPPPPRYPQYSYNADRVHNERDVRQRESRYIFDTSVELAREVPVRGAHTDMRSSPILMSTPVSQSWQAGAASTPPPAPRPYNHQGHTSGLLSRINQLLADNGFSPEDVAQIHTLYAAPPIEVGYHRVGNTQTVPTVAQPVDTAPYRDTNGDVTLQLPTSSVRYSPPLGSDETQYQLPPESHHHDQAQSPSYEIDLKQDEEEHKLALRLIRVMKRNAVKSREQVLMDKVESLKGQQEHENHRHVILEQELRDYKQQTFGRTPSEHPAYYSQQHNTSKGLNNSSLLNNSAQYMKQIKLPCFKGNRDPTSVQTFLQDFERFALAHGRSIDDALKLVMNEALQDNAQVFWNFYQSRYPMTWDIFKQEFVRYYIGDYLKRVKRELENRYQAPGEPLTNYIMVIDHYFNIADPYTTDSERIEQIKEKALGVYQPYMRENYSSVRDFAEHAIKIDEKIKRMWNPVHPPPSEQYVKPSLSFDKNQTLKLCEGWQPPVRNQEQRKSSVYYTSTHDTEDSRFSRIDVTIAGGKQITVVTPKESSLNDRIRTSRALDCSRERYKNKSISSSRASDGRSRSPLRGQSSSTNELSEQNNKIHERKYRKQSKKSNSPPLKLSENFCFYIESSPQPSNKSPVMSKDTRETFSANTLQPDAPKNRMENPSRN